MALSINDIHQLLSERGHGQYGGEAINQLEHGLQCAQLAEQAGETPHTVVACLLHDLGHLLAAQNKHQPDQTLERDDLHQNYVLPFLRGVFPDAVLEPIRLHVDAKRYLCTVEPGYWETLSPVSQHTLTLQGGPYTAAQAEAFARLPYSAEAVRLRRYDDLAKVAGLPTPSLAHYLPVMSSVCLLPS